MFNLTNSIILIVVKYFFLPIFHLVCIFSSKIKIDKETRNIIDLEDFSILEFDIWEIDVERERLIIQALNIIGGLTDTLVKLEFAYSFDHQKILE